MTNQDLLEDAFAALAEGDGSRFTALFADDMQVLGPPFAVLG